MKPFSGRIAIDLVNVFSAAEGGRVISTLAWGDEVRVLGTSKGRLKDLTPYSRDRRLRRGDQGSDRLCEAAVEEQRRRTERRRDAESPETRRPEVRHR